jgi:hypothetical protein
MSNYRVPTTNTTCCDGDDEEAPRAEVNVLLVVSIVSLMVFGICSLLVVCSSIFGLCRKTALTEVEDAASQEGKQERRGKRKESISNRLIIKEWVPDADPPVESTEGAKGTPLVGGAAEAPQPPASHINSSPASCAMGSDDCESLAGEEQEMAGCAICLSYFEPQQLVCESNNSSCQHVFHKDCIFDWLMKDHDTCPMCREVYLLKTL